MSDYRLIMLEQRLEELERSVLGACDVVIPDNTEPCLDQLDKFNKQFTKAVEKREKVVRLLNRVKEIEKYMDPTFLDDLALSNEAKIKIILAEDEKIRDTAVALKQIYKMKELLNSPHFQNLDALQEKLSALSQRHIEQKDESEAFCKEAKQLLQVYSDTIADLNKVYVQWDQQVSEKERTASK